MLDRCSVRTRKISTGAGRFVQRNLRIVRESTGSAFPAGCQGDAGGSAEPSTAAAGARGDPPPRRSRHFTPPGIHGSSLATSDLAPELTGMPQNSKSGLRFLPTIFE